MERELLMTGIGGQGVQLAAQLIAKTATRFGRYVQLFGSYGGMMRGGNTDATLIIGDEPVQAPPMVSSAWSALVMHHEFAAPTLERLRPGGVLVVNTSVVTAALQTRVPAAGRSGWRIPGHPSSPSSSAPPRPRRWWRSAPTRRHPDGRRSRNWSTPCPRRCRATARQHVASNARALRAGAEAAAGYGIARPGLAGDGDREADLMSAERAS